jgi:endonuclease/exonuclease/phosphatase family metal-dependent hydrolase
MASTLRLFTKRFIFYCNLLLLIFFILAIAAPYLNPQTWWFISFFGLAFPFLLVLMVCFLLGWVILKKWHYALICLLALGFGYKSIGVFLAFHWPAKFNDVKQPGSLRIVSWNVARFVEIKKVNNRGSQVRLKMMEQLKAQDADVLCLQEFQSSGWAEYYDNISFVQQQLHYPYYYFVFDEDGDKQYYSSIIFSRFPIVDSGVIRYPRPTLPDVLLHADLKVNQDTIRIYTTHLQSLQFKKSDYQKINRIERMEDSILHNSRSIASKLKRGFVNRSVQARIIHQVLGDSPHPVLFCADMNDVPNSYTYFMVKRNMQDAFLKKGFGIGRTFHSLSPTLRIDYIFADEHFRIKQFNRIVRDLSDHYMLVADVELKK